MSERAGPRLRMADREQKIPEMPLDNLIEADHQARLVWDFCQTLDLTPLLDLVRSRVGGPGHPAIDPRICVALWLYATLEGVGSARALASLCVHHNAFRWLTGGVSVNYHSLSDFRVRHIDFLDQLLTHSVAVLREQGLVDLNRVAIDGMRVRACAGAASFHRQATLDEHLEEARDQVARLKEEMEDDPSAGSRRQAAAQERAARERQERLEQALKRLPQLQAKKTEEEKEKTRVSTTDPEATVMKMGDGGYRPAYNVEYATACDGSQVIVGVDVITVGSDMGQIAPLVEQVEKRQEVRPKEVLVDGGLAKYKDIEEVEKKGTKVYAPVPKPKEKEKNQDRYKEREGESKELGGWRKRMGNGGREREIQAKGKHSGMQ